jgi:hypothetical protein
VVALFTLVIQPPLSPKNLQLPDVSSNILSATGNPFTFKTGEHVLKISGLDCTKEKIKQTQE